MGAGSEAAGGLPGGIIGPQPLVGGRE
jgi:hypothetical protein